MHIISALRNFIAPEPASTPPAAPLKGGPSAAVQPPAPPSSEPTDTIDFSQVNFNEKVSNRDVNETAADRQLIGDLGAPAKMHAEEDISKLNGTIPSTSQLQTEFNKLAADKEIPFKYIVDGCYARAHLMCDEMHKDNVNCAKMWVMVNDPKDGLTAHNEYMDATWHHFHVAPIVYAADDKTHQVQPYIMDPSMSDHPLRPQDWIHEMWDGKDPIHVDVTPDAQYGRLEAYGRQTDFGDSLAPAHEVLDGFSALLAKIEKNSQAA